MTNDFNDEWLQRRGTPQLPSITDSRSSAGTTDMNRDEGWILIRFSYTEAQDLEVTVRISNILRAWGMRSVCVQDNCKQNKLVNAMMAAVCIFI